MSIYTAKTESTNYEGVVKIIEIREGNLMYLQLTGETWQLTNETAEAGWYLVNGTAMSPEDFEKVKNNYLPPPKEPISINIPRGKL